MQRNETEIMKAETNLKLWNMRDKKVKAIVARQIASKCAKAEPTDIFVFDRIMSRLLEGSFCPEDLGFHIERDDIVVGDARKVSFS